MFKFVSENLMAQPIHSHPVHLKLNSDIFAPELKTIRPQSLIQSGQ